MSDKDNAKERSVRQILYEYYNAGGLEATTEKALSDLRNAMPDIQNLIRTADDSLIKKNGLCDGIGTKMTPDEIECVFSAIHSLIMEKLK